MQRKRRLPYLPAGLQWKVGLVFISIAILLPALMVWRENKLAGRKVSIQSVAIERQIRDQVQEIDTALQRGDLSPEKAKELRRETEQLRAKMMAAYMRKGGYLGARQAYELRLAVKENQHEIEAARRKG